MADLRTRTASAIVMIVLALASAWSGGQIFVLFWLVACFAVLWEWQKMIGGDASLARLLAGAAGLAAAAALVGVAHLAAACGVLVLASAGVAWLAGSGRGVWAAAGCLYAGLLLISVLVLRASLALGFEAVVWLFAIVWSTDIGAYFAGRAIGGPKLWPAVSPSKTWAGFVGGVLCGGLAGTALYALAISGRPGGWITMFFLALALAALSQGGDLFESSLKRRYGVKDSSSLIPGHGGFMDRLDGFWAACVCAALIGVVRGGEVNAAHGLFSW
ncbi:MAG: phosphatidate cytidylyltransferase [Beijerinckiaceae bacterium]